MVDNKSQAFIGISEISFKKGLDQETGLIGAIVKGSNLEGVVSGRVKIDGYDATDEVIRMIMSSKHKPLIKAVFLKGLSVAGFNVIDIQRVYAMTRVPVIVYILTYPEANKIEKALIKIGQPEKLEVYRKTDVIFPYVLSDIGPETNVSDNKTIYLQCVGLERDLACSYVQKTCTKSQLPECLRVAKIITHGLNPHIKDKPEPKIKRNHPEKQLQDIIDKYNTTISPNRAEDLAGTDDILLIADWVAKRDITLQLQIERLINMLSLNVEDS